MCLSFFLHWKIGQKQQKFSKFCGFAKKISIQNVKVYIYIHTYLDIFLGRFQSGSSWYISLLFVIYSYHTHSMKRPTTIQSCCVVVNIITNQISEVVFCSTGLQNNSNFLYHSNRLLEANNFTVWFWKSTFEQLCVKPSRAKHMIKFNSQC